MSLQAYLRSVRSYLTGSKGIDQSTTLSIAIGNESADLDSCVSSIVLSYAYTSMGIGTKVLVPLMNMDRQDMQLRKEFLLLLKQVGLDPGSLTFRDELCDEVKTRSNLDFFLLDHNHYRIETLPRSAATAHVSGIIDHHVDEGLYTQASPRIIRQCGSCTTLVTQYLHELAGKKALESEAQITRLSLSAILIDTAGLTKETTATDRTYVAGKIIADSAVVDLLKSRLVQTAATTGIDQDIAALNKAKRDVEGLTTAQLIRRDYKEWDLDQHGLWGVSSVTTSLDNVLGDSTSITAIESHAAKRNLDVYIMMTKHGEKEMLIYVHRASRRASVESFVQSATELLRLRARTDVPQRSDILTFQQLNTIATRKKVAEICQSI